MRLNGTKPLKGQMNFKFSMISFAGSSLTCTCEHPCSNTVIFKFHYISLDKQEESILNN